MLREMAERAREASRKLALADENAKNLALLEMAKALEKEQEAILAENEKDMEAGSGLTQALRDRLRLTPQRISGMAEGLRQVAALPDPVGETLRETVRPNGLRIVKKRVPIGVIAVIYEARPNVTADSAALCVKSGNAVILRGGKEAIRSNLAVGDVLRRALQRAGLPADCVQVVPDTSRETAQELMRLRGGVDVLIPRGGAGLIRSVVENAQVPVIETGAGTCHTYVDRAADLDMAVRILVNAKVSRPSVCNACECVLVHRDVAEAFLPRAAAAMPQVEIRGDERVRAILPMAKEATDDDWGKEYNDYILAARVVDSMEEAIGHIQRYGTGHSECVVTEDGAAAREFMDRIDAAAVYHNASTRFTDGGEFGLGAEIGISTQKLHARGPLGLEELTSTKYMIYGEGQVRG